FDGQSPDTYPNLCEFGQQASIYNWLTTTLSVSASSSAIPCFSIKTQHVGGYFGLLPSLLLLPLHKLNMSLTSPSSSSSCPDQPATSSPSIASHHAISILSSNVTLCLYGLDSQLEPLALLDRHMMFNDLPITFGHCGGGSYES
ncbi:unnamed protein product, partial [Absidia cylindrospora]